MSFLSTGITIPLVPVFLLVLSVFAIDAAYAFRVEEMPSLISCRMAAKVMAGVLDVDVLLGGILSTKDNTGYDKDGDNDANGGNDDEREIIKEEDGEQIRFLGGNSSSGIKKYRGLNSNEVCSTEWRLNTGEEIDQEFSKELKELLPNEAGK
ncbi:hypothetical protein Tco_1352772 [Tanacetum coccineum]